MNPLATWKILTVAAGLLTAVCCNAEERDSDLDAVDGPNVRVMRHEDGARTMFRRTPDNRVLTKKKFSPNGVLTMLTIYDMDSNENPLRCRILDGQNNMLFKVSYGYRRSDGQLVEERMFDARVVRRDPNTGKEMPVQRVCYVYDSQGNRSAPIIYNLLPGKTMEEVFGVKSSALETNPFKGEIPWRHRRSTKTLITRFPQNVPSPKTLLPLLLGAVAGVGGILQGLHWRAAASNAGNPELVDQLREAREQISMLERENESLRSLAQGGGEIAVDRQWIDHTEKEFGLHFQSTPVIHRIASEELRDRVAAALEIKFGPSGIDDRQEAYRLIGWLGADDDLLSQLTAMRAVGAKGWFDDVSGEAWVTDRYDSESIPDQAVLLRLLARILLNQNFPPPPAYPGDDAARARTALHQGAAAGSEARFYAANARAIGFVPMTQNPMVEQFFASLPTFIQGLTTFPIIQGKGFADTLFVQGNEKLHAALRNPPQTTRAVYFPIDSFSAPDELQLPAAPEEPYLAESAGMLGLFLWLEPASDVAMEIASAWKNDRYHLIPDGDASSAVVWDIVLDSDAAADKLLAATASFEDLAPENRHVKAIRQSPVRIRFLNTATPELAATLD